MINVLKCKFNMRTRILQVCFLLLFTTILCRGQQQYHQLKFINTNQTINVGSAPQYSSMTITATAGGVPDTMKRFSRADRICIAGMWALYNTTNYGEGAEDITTVISIKGTNVNRCTDSGAYPVLKTVQSLRYLGNADYSQDGVHIYSQPYFLGGRWDATPTNALPAFVSGVSLGSIAITGEKLWAICSDSMCTTGVCINAKVYGNLFIQRNTLRDTTIPDGWPKIVRAVKPVSPDDCSNYATPPPPTRVARNAGDDNIQINVFTH